MQTTSLRKIQPCNPERGDVARKKLIEAGLKIFSDVGYEAASTRDLAAAAGVNIAAIPYYFRSKEGLYNAVIDHIIDYLRDGLGDELFKIKAALKDKNTTQAEFHALLNSYTRTQIRFVLRPCRELAQASHIYIREQLDPSSAFDRLYEGFIREAQDTLAELVAHVIGVNDVTPDARLLAQTMNGQILVFKLSQETIQHNIGWKKYGEEEISAIERIIMANIASILQTHQEKGFAP